MITINSKVVAKNKFRKRFSYVGVSPIPQINIHEFSLKLSHFILGPQALIRVLFKTKIFVEN